MRIISTRLNPNDEKHVCKSCGHVAEPGGDILLMIEDDGANFNVDDNGKQRVAIKPSEKNRLWHFKCPLCRDFMKEEQGYEPLQ